MQGWYHHIVMTEKGELYITGPLSNGSMTIGCYGGNELLLSKVSAYKEIEYQIQWDDIEFAWEDEKEKNNNISNILNEIIFENEVEELKKECEEKGEVFTLEKCINTYYTYPLVEIAIKNLFPEVWDIIVNEYTYNEWDYDKSIIESNIENTIDILKSHLMEF